MRLLAILFHLYPFVDKYVILVYTKTMDSAICFQAAWNLLSLTGINEFQITIFVLYYLTALIHTKTTIHQCQWPAFRSSVNVHHEPSPPW